MLWTGLGPDWRSHETRAAGPNARFENQAFQNQQISVQSCTRWLSFQSFRLEKLILFCARCSNLSQGKSSVALTCKPRQGVDYGRRNHRHRRFAATGGLSATGHYLNIHRNGNILYIRRSVAIPVTLFHTAVFERDGSMGHQLRNAKTHATLHLALDRQWIDCKSWVHGNRRAMDSWTPVFNGDLHRTSHTRPEAFMTRNSDSVIAGKTGPP